MKFNKIDKISQNLAAQMDNEKPFLASVIRVKLAKLAEEYPYDQTVIQMSNILNKISEKNLFIKRAELKDIYNKFQTNSNVVSEYLSEELGDLTSGYLKPKYASTSDEVLPVYQSQDLVLQNLLNSVLNGDEVKAYSQKVADAAVKKAETILELNGVKPTKISVATGNEQYIIVSASFDTPKGSTSCFIPVKTSSDKIFIPEVFVTDSGASELSKHALTSYLQTKAGVLMKTAASTVLDAITDKKEKISKVDLIVAAMKVEKAESKAAEDMSGHSIIADFHPEFHAVPEVKLAESETFESKLSTNAGKAEFIFGTKTIEAARSILDKKLKKMGYKNNQLKVASCDKSGVSFAVCTLGNRIGFTVPMKIKEGTVIEPTVLICEGSIAPLTSQFIDKMLNDGIVDRKSLALNSSHNDLKNSELLEIIRVAALDNNIDRAEDALNVLAQRDSDCYLQGVSLFKDNLGKKVASVVNKCNFVVKNATRMKPLCGHLNVPLDEVYQDAHGSCVHISRKGNEKIAETTGFFYNKIFM